MLKLVLSLGIYLAMVLALGFVMAMTAPHEGLEQDSRDDEF